MLVVIPISKTDAKFSANLERGMDINPPGDNHDLVIVCQGADREEAQDLEGRIKRHFKTSQVHSLASTSDSGWPWAMNFMFQQTVYFLTGKMQPNQGWLWLEMDSLPIKPNWLSTIEKEYYADSERSVEEKREPYRFLGVKENTIIGRHGDLVPASEAGSHMAAVGVYPANIAEIVPIIPAITGDQRPFYIRAQWYVIKSLNSSKLIQNNWRTGNYRMQGYHILCDSLANWTWNIHFNNIVGKETVLLHGVKDSSLIDILCNKHKNLENKKQENGVATIPSANELAQELEITNELIPMQIMPEVEPQARKKRGRPTNASRKILWEKSQAEKAKRDELIKQELAVAEEFQKKLKEEAQKKLAINEVIVEDEIQSQSPNA